MAGVAGVYIWLNLVNGKVYVGSAKFIPRRKSAHLRALKLGKHHSPHFQAAWDKYGEAAFQFGIVEEVLDELWLRARETVWIKQLRSAESVYGYNIARDGWTAAQLEPTERRREAWKKNGERKRGVQDPPEVRARKKAASQGRTPPSHLNHKHSEETRAKMRAAWARNKARGYTSPVTFTTAGRPSWNKGIPPSKESRQKLSISLRLSWTPERRAAQAERARKQGLANSKNQHKIGATEPRCVVEVS